MKLVFEPLCIYGILCLYLQLDYDECQSNPCQNDGLCQDVFNGYLCFCKNGFTGKE